MTDRICSIDGCSRPLKARGWCKIHWQRWRRNGTTDDPPTEEQRFWAKVDTSNPDCCWEWQGKRTEQGYGMFFTNRRWFAHRYIATLLGGDIPEGVFICHHCDNPPCVRPSHLYRGDVRTNHADHMARGRKPRGETHSNSKLTEADVRALRALRAQGLPLKQLALIFGLSETHVSEIAHRKSWRHVA